MATVLSLPNLESQSPNQGRMDLKAPWSTAAGILILPARGMEVWHE